METFLKNCKWGQMLLLRGDMISQYADLYGEWSELEVSLFRDILQADSNVVEIGANIGLHTIPLSKIVSQGKVICFEPQRMIFQMLCANCALNNRINVYAYNQAIGDSEERLEIACTDYRDPWNYGAYSVARGYNTERPFQGNEWVEHVQLIRLDDHPQVDGLDSIQLLKIDVEGMEMAVLAGAAGLIQRHRPYLFIENNNVENGDKLILAIHDLGYEAYWFCTERFSEQNYNRVQWRIPGGDINMICFPREQAVNSVPFAKVHGYRDLKEGRSPWIKREPYPAI